MSRAREFGPHANQAGESAARSGTGEYQLSTPVQYLKGVGPQRAELLQRLQLKTAADLLFFFPRDYQDMSEVRSVEQLEEGQPASVRGVIDEVELRQTGAGRSILGALIRCESEFLRAMWFNQPYMQKKLALGRHVLLSGSPKRNAFRWEMHHPQVEFLDAGERGPKGRVMPVYSLTEGISQVKMRKIVHGVVATHTRLLEEVMPHQLLDAQNLWPIQAALPQIHAPDDPEALVQARRRFVFQELLVMQLALALRKRRLTESRRAPPLPPSAKINARILRLFPFELTSDQRRAMEEIGADMARGFPMNRLLQGDVASGKTVVAEYAMLLAVAHGYQAALMAPTEILARQHLETLQRDLNQSRVRIELLVGSHSAQQRNDILQAAGRGEIDLLIGTHTIAHAMTQEAEGESEWFARLGLVIIDEQHKFGVRQRASLKRAGLEPHYLVMTATPIPRTVSMTLFGDLEISTLRESPPARQPVNTYLSDDQQRERWWEFFRKKLREGRQGYVIAPLVREDEEVASVERLYESLCNDTLEAFRVGLVHGRMSARDKDDAMRAFREGETQVLVATSVVEVGVNVPNATVMTIEDAERFGLAQLHQLRGRIARGAFPGFLCVFSASRSDDAQRRLQAFAQTRDGFELAELDFQLRGPGDLFGAKQHGLPPLRIANLIDDHEELEQARSLAQSLLRDDPELLDPSYAKLRRMVIARYGRSLELGDVG